MIELEIERLSQTEAWTRLSPILREVLALHFRIGGDLVEAVQTTHSHFTRQRAAAVAASMLEDLNVQAVLLLRSGAVVISDAPPPGSLDDLVRREEWRALEPLKIKLRPGISETGETLDLQRILRLYFTTARENMLDAIGMYRPDLDQSAGAEVARAIWESPDVRRILALRRGAE